MLGRVGVYIERFHLYGQSPDRNGVVCGPRFRVSLTVLAHSGRSDTMVLRLAWLLTLLVILGAT